MLQNSCDLPIHADFSHRLTLQTLADEAGHFIGTRGPFHSPVTSLAPMNVPNDKRPSERVLTNAATRVQLHIVQSGVETSGRLLELKATYPAHTAAPPPHYHPHQDESFVVLSGQMMVNVAGKVSPLHAGDVIAIPAGTPHAMWNAADEPSVVTWRTMPAMQTEEFFRDVYRLAAQGRTTADGTPHLMDLAWLVPRYWNEIRVTRPPEFVQRIVFSALKPFTRFRPVRAPAPAYVRR